MIGYLLYTGHKVGSHMCPCPSDRSVSGMTQGGEPMLLGKVWRCQISIMPKDPCKRRLLGGPSHVRSLPQWLLVFLNLPTTFALYLPLTSFYPTERSLVFCLIFSSMACFSWVFALPDPKRATLSFPMPQFWGAQLWVPAMLSICPEVKNIFKTLSSGGA